MADWRFFFIVLAISWVSVFGDGEDGLPPSRIIPVTTASVPTTTTVPTTTPALTTTPGPTTTTGPTTTLKPTTPPASTTTPNPTTAPTTTTTPKPTTKPAPTTTTLAPTTITNPTTTPASTTTPKTTTTPKPTTTPAPKTTPKPTTTPAPTPAPAPVPPTTGVWNVTDNNNITCILAKFAGQFNVSYAAGKEFKTARFNLPSDSLSNGSCGNTTEWMTLSWPKQQDASKQNNLTLVYKMNTTSHQYYISEIKVALVYDAQIFPNASYTGIMKLSMKSKVWTSTVNYSYRCMVPQSVKLMTDLNGPSNQAADLVLYDVQEEAFRSVKGHQFGIAVDCAAMDVPDVVPIAVGCALGGLVLVVLVAYLVGRKWSRSQQGYVSM